MLVFHAWRQRQAIAKRSRQPDLHRVLDKSELYDATQSQKRKEEHPGQYINCGSPGSEVTGLADLVCLHLYVLYNDILEIQSCSEHKHKESYYIPNQSINRH